jgi:hypothetical protein
MSDQKLDQDVVEEMTQLHEAVGAVHLKLAEVTEHLGAATRDLVPEVAVGESDAPPPPGKAENATNAEAPPIE